MRPTAPSRPDFVPVPAPATPSSVVVRPRPLYQGGRGTRSSGTRWGRDGTRSLIGFPVRLARSPRVTPTSAPRRFGWNRHRSRWTTALLGRCTTRKTARSLPMPFSWRATCSVAGGHIVGRSVSVSVAGACNDPAKAARGNSGEWEPRRPGVTSGASCVPAGAWRVGGGI
jgi:hypothetical protein